MDPGQGLRAEPDGVPCVGSISGRDRLMPTAAGQEEQGCSDQAQSARARADIDEIPVGLLLIRRIVQDDDVLTLLRRSGFTRHVLDRERVGRQAIVDDELVGQRVRDRNLLDPSLQAAGVGPTEVELIIFPLRRRLIRVALSIVASA